MTVIVATDGAALPTNPGPGGWGWVTEDGREGSGGVRRSTNNRMELQAVLEALRALDGPLHILSDSRYVVDIFTRWLPGWRAKGRLLPGAKKPVKNRELIEAIDAELQGRDVTFEWVRGHAGHVLNERADALANAEAEWVVHASGVEIPEDAGLPDEPPQEELPWGAGERRVVRSTVSPSRGKRAEGRDQWRADEGDYQRRLRDRRDELPGRAG